jgi:peroxiredoxin
MSDDLYELTDSEPIADEADADAPATLVIHIGWVHAVVGLLAVLGVVGALGLGLWVSRERLARRGVAQTGSLTPGQIQALQPRVLQPAPPQVVPLQPQPVPQPQSVQRQPRSSAGVTTSIGGTPNVGDPAPDFTLKTLDGEKVSLSDFKGRPVLINFWATWCPPCRFEMPAIERAWQQYKDDGFVVLAVDVEEPISVVQRFVESFGLTFPVLLDYKGDVSDMYRLRAFPTTYFVGRDGKIVIAHRGMMTEQILQQYMERVMATKAE